MIYTSTQGEERVFPQYFAAPASQRLRPSRNGVARIGEPRLVTFALKSRRCCCSLGTPNSSAETSRAVIPSSPRIPEPEWQQSRIIHRWAPRARIAREKR